MKRAHWGTKIGFILATAGSAVGLGNIWKFPYATGVNGGGAFVLIYILCALVIGIPVMLAEFIIGRSTQQNPIGAFHKLEGKKNLWSTPGYIGVVAAFLILSYYSVVAGWVLDYFFKACTGAFTNCHDPAEIKTMLGSLLANGDWQVFLLFVFTALCVFIIMFGVRGGIEKASNIMMPLLVAILLILFVYSFTQPGNSKALSFLFYPNFSKLSYSGVLAALGHAFFTLSIGMGALITYGSYLKRDQKLISSALIIAALDTGIALMGGVVVFSIVFTFNLEPGAGPALIFSTLPALFAQLPGGNIIAFAFFLLLGFAALTSAISIFEVVVAYIIDTYGFGRKLTTITVGVFSFLIGILSAYSTNRFSDIKLPLAFLFGQNDSFLDAFDKLSTQIFLPLGGLLIAIYVGWKMDNEKIKAELTESERKILPYLSFTLKYLAPILIGIVFLYSLPLTKRLFT